MALLWVWLFCLPGVLGMRSTSAPMFPSPTTLSSQRERALLGLDRIGDLVVPQFETFLEGPRRALLSTDAACLDACNDTFVDCYDNCTLSSCQNACTNNQTACNTLCHHCGNLTLVNGVVTYSNADRGGSVATYTCNGGFNLQGGSTRTCSIVNDTWVDSAPRSCLGVACAALGTPSFGTNNLVPTPAPRYPLAAKFLCNTGRQLSGGNSTVYCGWDGFWYKNNATQPFNQFDAVADMPACADIDECALNATICDKTTTQCNNTVGSYACNCLPGYYLSAPNTCTGLPCEHLASLVNGIWNYTVNGTILQSNNYDCRYPCNATLACNPGMVPSNVSKQSCTTSLSWNVPASQTVCIGKICSGQFPITNTTLTANLVTSWGAYPPAGRFQDTITVTCKPGYQLQSGSTSWTCLGNGNWDCNGTCSMPVCVGQPCDIPVNYAKGVAVFSNSRNYPSSINYTCQNGYDQTGAPGTYDCQLPGLNWANTNTPVCSGKTCGLPPNSTSTVVTDWTSTIYPASANYACRNTYFTSSTLSTACQNNGNWPSVPTCYVRQITGVLPINLTNNIGTSNIVLTGTFGESNSITISSLTFGPGSNEFVYSIATRTVNSQTQITATPPPGVGGPYNLLLTASHPNSGVYTVRQLAAFSYPPPTMSDTISIAYNDGTTGVVNGAINLKSTLGGDMLTISGTFFGLDITRVFVTIGDTSNGRLPFVCEVKTVTNNQVKCKVPFGDNGPHKFRVGTGINEVIGNGVPDGSTILWSAYSNTTIRYPAGPVIDKVQGCSVNLAYGTSSCPTIGNIQIAISGTGFLGGANTTDDKPVVTVAGDFCGYINHTASLIICTLPSGTGLNQLVVVATAQGLAQRTLVSYVSATVDNVTGCLNDCSRSGGDSLTLTGDNFGSCCASVIVGDIACTAVRHDDYFPHKKLTCILAPDKGLAKSIILQQNRGQVTYVQNALVSFEQCPKGTFDQPAPSRTCTACGLGRYTDVEAMTSCIDCEVGTYQPSTGQSSCISAEKSTYVDTRAASRSLPCPNGTFSTDVGRASCPLCEAGTYARLTGNSICQPCAAGSAQQVPGQSSCILCSAGKFASSPGQYVCSDCPPGFVQPLTGKSVCTACYRGTKSLNTISCINCTIGSYSNRDGLAVCERCQPGFFQDVSGTTLCIDCVPGKYQAAYLATKCDPCEVGKFQNLYQQDKCQQCNAGTVTNVIGSVLCPPCLAGTYSPSDGQAACTQCALGKFSARPGQVACLDCNKGFVGPVLGLTVCAACNAGSIAANDGATVCTACQAGTYSPTFGQSSCTDCDLGFSTKVSGSSFCTACTPGYFAPNSAATVCSPCGTGTYSENLQSFQCKPCEAGRSSNFLALPVNCAVCPPGTYVDVSAATSCVSCPPGTFNGNSASSLCMTCNPGSFADVPGTTRCQACNVGKYANVDGLSSCLDCLKGYFSSFNGTTICTACTAGTYAVSTAMSYCELCVPGKFVEASGQSACSDCPLGRYSSDNPRLCTECDAGTYAISQGLPACVGCEPGTYAQAGGLSSCLVCQTGRNADSIGSKLCRQCELGKFANSTGQSACDDCDPGRAAQDPGLNLCRDCDPGSSAQQPGSKKCGLCDIGSFQNESLATSCEACAPGFFADKEGMANCEPCSVGRASQGRFDFCGLCVPGKYAEQPAQANCDDCARGRYISTPGNSACIDCLPGTFAGLAATPLCALCDPGRHSNESAAFACEDCSEGTEAPAFASAVCDSCQPGKFATFAQSRCGDCAPGKINVYYGKSNCTDCDPGTYNPEEGGINCTACTPGRYANSAGQSHCTFCAPGKFSNQSSALQCTDCPPGKYQEATMTTTCFDCGIGKASAGGLPKCDDCLSQTAMPYKAQPICLVCDPRSKQSELKDECVCNPGTYAPIRTGPSQPNLPCEECPRGGDCTTKGTTFANIGSAYGFWRQDASQLIFYQCQMPDYCPGGNVSSCSGHRTGALCGFCLPGYAASGAGGLGECSECTSTGASAATVVAISITAIVVIFILYYIVLYSDRKLLAKLKERQKAQATQLKQDYEQVDSSAFDNFEEGIEKLTNRANQERLRPNPVYKLKIVLGFFQIMSNLAFGISFGWPTLYRKFLMIFNIINMDFFPWGSMSCLATMTYKSKLIIITMTPVGLFVLLVCLYVLPKLYRDRRDMSDDDDLRNRRERSRIKFMKLVLFTVFAMFPFIASSVVKLWVCREIDGVSYLLADMGIRCYEEQWNDMLPMGVIFVLIYPVGIPLTFLGLLLFFRKRFKDPDVRIRLGFIYAAYTDDNWWFELYDISSKLYLTSLVVFFGESLQYYAVLIWLGIYILVVLIRKPYITKGDDRLQLFSILEIYLLVSCAMVLKDYGKMDDVLDTFLSVCLIFLTLLIALGGFVMIARNLRKMYFERKRKQLIEKGMLSNPDEDLSLADETAEEQVLSWATKVRLRAVQLPKKLVAPPKAPPRVKPARPPRKEVEEQTVVTHAHRAPARYGGRVLAAVQNIEAKHAESNSWQTMYTSKSTMRLPEATETTEVVPVPVDPFAAAPGETREAPAATVVVKKTIRPTVGAANASFKPFKPVSPKPAESAAPTERATPSALPRSTSGVDVTSELQGKLKSRLTAAEPKPSKPKKAEPETGDANVDAGPQDSDAVSEKPKAKEPPPRPARDSQVVAQTSIDAEAKNEQDTTAKPKGLPPKSRASPEPLAQTPTSLSPTNTELSSEDPAQARPAKPVKLARQPREN